mgnify:CR=1 FL=1
MKIKKTKISETESNLNLHLEKKDYIDKFDSQLKDLKRKANLKGFRPGMVPIQLLKNMYGKSVLLEEINKIVSENINNYIKENKIKIIGEPKPQKNEIDNININEIDEEAKKYPIVTKVEKGVTLNAIMSNSFGFGGTNATLVFEKIN